MRQVYIVLALCIYFCPYVSRAQEPGEKITKISSLAGTTFAFLQLENASFVLYRHNISMQDVDINKMTYQFSYIHQKAYEEALHNIKTIKLNQDDYEFLQNNPNKHPVYEILTNVFSPMLRQEFSDALQQNNLFGEFFPQYLQRGSIIMSGLLGNIQKSQPELLKNQTGIANVVNKATFDILRQFQNQERFKVVDNKKAQKQIREFWEVVFKFVPTNVYHEDSQFTLIIFEYNRARYPEMFVAPMLQEIIENTKSEDISQNKAAEYVWELLHFNEYANTISDKSDKQEMAKHHLRNINTLLELLLDKQSVRPEDTPTSGFEHNIADSLESFENEIQPQDIKQEAFDILKTLNKHGLLREEEVQRWIDKSDLLRQYYKQYFDISENLKQLYNALEALQAHIPKSK